MRNILNLKQLGVTIIAIFVLMSAASIAISHDLYRSGNGNLFIQTHGKVCTVIEYNVPVDFAPQIPEIVDFPISTKPEHIAACNKAFAAIKPVYRTAKNGTKTDRPTRMLDAVTKAKERVAINVICGDLVKINRGYRWHKVLNNTRTAVCK